MAAHGTRSGKRGKAKVVHPYTKYKRLPLAQQLAVFYFYRYIVTHGAEGWNNKAVTKEERKEGKNPPTSLKHYRASNYISENILPGSWHSIAKRMASLAKQIAATGREQADSIKQQVKNAKKAGIKFDVCGENVIPT